MLSDVELSSLTPELRQRVLALDQRAKRLELENQHFRILLRLVRIEKYGAASEKLSDEQMELLEQEPGVWAGEVQMEAQLEERQKRVNTGNRRGAQSLPPELPREEVLIACAEKDCECPRCKCQREVIGYETSERLHRIPARYVVKVFKREKRACRRCEEGGVATAKAPAFIIEKGIGSNELVVDTLLSKYELHQPLYRQEAQMEREGIALMSRSTMCDWMMECGFLLQAVREQMRIELIRGAYIQADETPVGVQSSAVKGRNHRGYLWQYGVPGGSVIFDYQDGRGRDGPIKILKGFRGVLQTDAYAVYESLNLPGVKLAACMAHVRRKFKEAVEAGCTEPQLMQILGSIAALYRVEEQVRELAPEQRLELRQSQSLPLLRELKSRILQLREEVLPKGLPGKACDYALSVWKKLEVIFQTGVIEIDNNTAERSIRPVALGRKNWLHLGSKEAGPRIAAILSAVESCHRLNIPAREYLLDVLPRLSTGNRSIIAELTPQAWIKARA